MLHELAVGVAVGTDTSDGDVDFNGRWYNQMESWMELDVDGSDVTGTYTSKTSGTGSGGEITGSLKGYVAGDRISFIVLWRGGSMTAWTGQVTGQGRDTRIKTLWNLVTDVPDQKEPKYLWQSTFTGADEFARRGP